jgi:hypothetical protein
MQACGQQKLLFSASCWHLAGCPAETQKVTCNFNKKTGSKNVQEFCENVISYQKNFSKKRELRNNLRNSSFLGK